MRKTRQFRVAFSSSVIDRRRFCAQSAQLGSKHARSTSVVGYSWYDGQNPLQRHYVLTFVDSRPRTIREHDEGNILKGLSTLFF